MDKQYLLETQAWVREELDRCVNFWLKNGDVLLISIHCTFAFNLFMLLKNLLLFIKEKIKLLWLKNIKKSTI